MLKNTVLDVKKYPVGEKYRFGLRRIPARMPTNQTLAVDVQKYRYFSSAIWWMGESIVLDGKIPSPLLIRYSCRRVRVACVWFGFVSLLLLLLLLLAARWGNTWLRRSHKHRTFMLPPPLPPLPQPSLNYLLLIRCRCRRVRVARVL